MSFTREETSLRHLRKCISIIEVKAVPFERRKLSLFVGALKRVGDGEHVISCDNDLIRSRLCGVLAFHNLVALVPFHEP